MASYNPPSAEPEVRVEQRKFMDGTRIDQTLYKTRVPVEVNCALLLRSISYEESDVLVALRVVRKDADGSLIIAWKLLKTYPKPILARRN
jgi:hypothetical protein